LAVKQFVFVLISNFSIKDSELYEKVDLTEFISLNVPRLDKRYYEDVLFNNYKKDYQSSLDKYSELIKVSVGNFYDQQLNLNEYIYSTGFVLEDENRKRQAGEKDLQPLVRTIEKCMSNLHIKNISENLNNLLKRKIEKNLTDNISPSQKLLLFSAFLAYNSPSKMDTVLFRNVKRTGTRIKVRLIV
jgi:hypothetical protein